MGELMNEYALFEQALPSLIATHRGEFGLFRDGQAIGFFDSYHAAYVAGLDAFGVDGQFLIAEIKESEPKPISISWQSGVMFDSDE